LTCAISAVIFTFLPNFHSRPSFQSSVKTIIEEHPAATGTVFTLNKIRKYEEAELNENLERHQKNYKTSDAEPLENADFKLCEKWGVLTTILPVSEAVRKFLYKPDWCVVVVGDLEKPQVSSKKSQLDYSS
jgi:hypothetical protein